MGPKRRLFISLRRQSGRNRPRGRHREPRSRTPMSHLNMTPRSGRHRCMRFPVAAARSASIAPRLATNIIRGAVSCLLATGLAGGLCAQTLSSIGPAAPSPGPNDISQLSAGNTTSPDSLNYYTDNGAPAGQRLTTGAGAMKLKSVAIKTALRRSKPSP